MKLVEVWNAQFAWKALSSMKVSPQWSYNLMTYGDKFEAELAKADKLRIAIVCEIAGVEPGSPEANGVFLAEGTPEFAEFQKKFNEVLNVESDLDVFGMGMDMLVKVLSEKEGNALSKDDLRFLKPFFQEKL